MADTVKVKKGNRTAVVVQSAYDKVWKGRGWEIVKDEPKKKAAKKSATTGSSS